MIYRKRSRVPTKTRTLDKAVRYPWDSGKELFPSRTKKKASEPEGSEAVIPTISLVALSCGDGETVSGGTRQHQSASSKASSRYSHSIAKNSLQFVSVCRSLLQFVPFASSLKKCRESIGSYLGHGKLRALTDGHMDIACQRRQGREAPTGPSSYDGSPIFDLYSSIRSSEQSMPAASKTIFSVSIFT